MKIFDASSIICLIHEAKFTKIFQICQNKGYRLLIPNTVFEELKRNEKTYNFIKSVDYFEPIEIIDSDCYEYLQRRYPQLHHGEIGVICCGLSKRKDKQKYICIIDENKNRTRFCLALYEKVVFHLKSSYTSITKSLK